MFRPTHISDKINFLTLLAYTLITPINQREFSWDPEKDVYLFLSDALASFLSGEQYEIGDFITFHSNGEVYVFDGQSRLTCVLLFLAACIEHIKPIEKFNRLIPKIQGYIFLDSDVLDESSNKDIDAIKKKYGWTYYPRMKSCYESNFSQMGHILNGTSGIDFETPLGKASVECARFISSNKLDIPTLTNFVKFLLQSTTAIEKKAMSSLDAARLMDRANNRGVHLTQFENMRNLLVTWAHPNHQKMSERLERLNRTPKIWETAALIFTQDYVIPPEHYLSNTVKKIIQSDDNVKSFLDEAEKAVIFLENIMPTPFGRRYPELVWGCIIPWSIRNNIQKPDYEFLHRIGNRLIQMGCYSSNAAKNIGPWHAAFKKSVVENTPFCMPRISANAMQIAQSICEPPGGTPMNRTDRLFILYQLARLYQTWGSTLNPDNLDIEHISGKKCNDGVERKEWLGNLTLLEGSNDPMIKEFRGNRSLGALPYSQKKNMYVRSSVKMTNNVVYDTFNDTIIIHRTRALIQLLIDAPSN